MSQTFVCSEKFTKIECPLQRQKLHDLNSEKCPTRIFNTNESQDAALFCCFITFFRMCKIIQVNYTNNNLV